MIRDAPATMTAEEIYQLSEDHRIAVDFWAQTCIPCRMLGKSLEEADKELDEGVEIIKVNVMEAPELANAFFVDMVPQLFIIENRQIVEKAAGALSKDKVLHLLTF